MTVSTCFAAQRGTGPFTVPQRRQAQLVFALTGIVASAQSGTPTNPAAASANVRQAITILGDGFDLDTEVVCPTIESGNATLSNRKVKPTRVFVVQGTGSGAAIEVVVPDDAITGNVSVVGAPGSFLLQIVPTIVDLDLLSTGFDTGSSFQISGSGFIEGSLTVNFGATTVVDTSASTGPNIFNLGIDAGLDRSDNDGISLTVPAGAFPGLITVTTSGGVSAAMLISVAQIVSTALAGTPASGAQPSANPGQLIRIQGGGFDITTEAVFPVIDISGTVTTRAVLPDFVKVDGTMMEVRVPEDALTGTIRVIGSPGAFTLQIVPTLRLVEPYSSNTIRLLGSGFTENSGLSVKFGAVTVGDSGVNIDVSSNFLANDLLSLTLPAGGTNPVSVTTAGGTSQAINISVDDPPGVGEMRDLAIFPATAGADAGEFVVAESSGNLRVLDPVTLALIRTITRPGTASTQIGLDFLPEAITVQDAVRGAVNVPAGSLMVANGADTPDRLYYLNPAVAGTVLADVPFGANTPLDETGAVGLAYDLNRHLIVALRSSDLVTEINPATGAAFRSFHTGFSVGAGDVAVRPGAGTLLVSGSQSRLIEIDPLTGRIIGNYDTIANTQFGTIDLRQQGVGFQGIGDLSGLAFDGAGNLLATSSNASDGNGQRILRITLPGAPTSLQVDSAMAVAIDGTPADPVQPSANSRQRIRIIGSGYNRFTEVEFPRIDSAGKQGFVRVRTDVVSADGTALEVVVPDEAVTGYVRVSGAPGTGLFLQITPTIRAALPADTAINFDVPLAGLRWGLWGSGLVEGRTRITIGGIQINDNSTTSDVDVITNIFTIQRNNGRLDLTIPERALAGPVKIETAGGSFQLNAHPVQAQPSVGVEAIVERASQGTPANSALPAANAGQVIVLRGYGFTTTSSILFSGVGEEGLRRQILVRPTSVSTDGTQATVRVPALAVTGPVTAAGATTSVTLQIVPTLNGISTGSISAGLPIRLSGSGIPEGGPGPGESVTYTIGDGSVLDNDGTLGPNVFSALDATREIDLVLPAAATGSVVTVTTAGGSATLRLIDLATSTVAAEGQGSSATDGVGGTLDTALGVALDPNHLLAITGRVNVADDVDLYRLVGAQAGGILTLSATGAQRNARSGSSTKPGRR